MMNRQAALNQYRQMGAAANIQDATPHRLVEILMEAALQKIAAAKGFMERQKVAEKGKQISWAISIIDTLRASLNTEVGGELAENLSALYDYMGRTLLEANLSDDVAKLEEASTLMGQVLEGWREIPQDQRHIQSDAAAASSDQLLSAGV